MRRVLIIGSGGSGKSTLARRLGQLTNLEVIHLDQLYWRSGWVETPKTEWLEVVDGILQRGQWIMDGNYSGTLDVRLKTCDTVIFLDLPRIICIWRVLVRRVKNLGRSRRDMGSGCPERFNPEFIRWVWNYPIRSKPRVLQLLEKYRASKRIIALDSARAVREFLSEFET